MTTRSCARPAAGATVPSAIARDWLALQCRMVPRTQRGVLALRDAGSDALEPVAAWPTGSPPSPELLEIARLALDRDSPMVAGSPAGREQRLGIALPLTGAGPAGVVALDVAATPAEQEAIIRLMRWGMAFLALASRSAAPTDPGGNALLQMLAKVLAQADATAAATALASELAHRTRCDRASVGLRRRGSVRLIAVSDAARLDARTNLARRIEAAMDEALEHETTIAHPTAAPAAPTPALTSLAEAEGSGAVIALALRAGGRPVGSLVLERSSAGPFDAAAVKLAEGAAALAAPVLERELASERSTLSRLGAALADRRNRTRRVAVVAVLAAAALVSLAKGEYRVSASASLEGTVHRAVVVPFDGFVVSARARAGDTVAQEELLAELDDRDLRLSLRRLAGEREELAKERGKAFAAQDYAEVRILDSRIGQVQARVELAEEQLTRSRLTAPFAGVVVTGDLSRSLGSPVARGDVLFEIAPLDSYRVAISVEDRNIADVAVGQRGIITLSALPGDRLTFEVTSVAAVSGDEEDSPTYRVEANLLGRPDRVRPGMGGIAKIEVGERRLIDAWTRPLTNRLRLWLWRWLP